LLGGPFGQRKRRLFLEIKNDLIVTVYLNQKVVFDLLAIVENGFTQIRSVERKERSQDSTGSEVEGGIGTGNVFGLFSLKLNTKMKADGQREENQSVSEERIHTPTSLFSKLLSYLEENELLREISKTEDLKTLNPGGFVKIKGTISVNPVIRAFDSMNQMMNMFASMVPKTPGKNNGDTTKKTMEQLKKLSDGLRSSGTIDLLQKNQGGVEAVSQAELKYFENANVGILEDGEYTVVGKVIKVVDQDSDPINLLRNTSMNAVGEAMVDQMFSYFDSEEAKNAGLDLPPLRVRISTGILIIPIGIYS